jgi:tetratricopeptide (TPR) repeat protein
MLIFRKDVQSLSFFVRTISIILFFFATTTICSCSDREKHAKVHEHEKEIKIDYFDCDAPKTKSINGIEYTLIDKYVKLVPVLYKEKDFKRIEHHISQLLSAKDENSENELYCLYKRLGHVTDSKHIQLMQDVLNEWCILSESHIPWIVNGIFNINVGWKIRGVGWASTVSKKSMEQFHEYLELAKNDLERAYSLNPNDPNSSCHLLTVAIALGKPIKEIEEIYQKGLTTNPHHFGLHSKMLACLTPKWGGSYQAMMDFADHCMSFADYYPRFGLIKASALVEVHKYIAPEKQKFLEEENNWRIVENAYKRFVRKYSDNILLRYIYAKAALLANKNEIAIEQFEIIGDRWYFGNCWSSLESFNRGRGRAYNNMAVGLTKKRQYDSAEKHYLLAVKYNPSAQYYYNLALAQWHQAKSSGSILSWKKAEKSLIKAVSLSPDNKTAKDDLKTLQAYLKTLGQFG